MKRQNIVLGLSAVLLVVACGGNRQDSQEDEAIQVVSDFYENIRNRDYDNAMLCTNLPYDEAMQLSAIFNELGMEIHEFGVDSVQHSTDSTAVVFVHVKASNAFSNDTAESVPAIPCIKIASGWRVLLNL